MNTNPCLPQRTSASKAGSRRVARRSRHASSFSDAVVAVYIHDISARHVSSRSARPAASRG